MVPRKHRYRPLINDYRTAGSVLAEMPVALWILFVGIGLPLIVAITIALRYGLFWQAARQAAQACCQTQTFYAPPTATATSAVQAANTAANNTVNAFGGCSLNEVDVYIGQTPFNSLNTTWSSNPNTPLQASQIDTDQNIYSVKVVLIGEVQPLVTLNVPYLGSIPGLTQSCPATVAEERVFEHASGLSE